MNDNFIGMDITNTGPQPDAPKCFETCNGELREACGGCPFYDENGEVIDGALK
jgi:hypothetical protein